MTTIDDLAPLREELLRLGTATLYEASGIDCFLPAELRPAWPGASIVGVALPVSTAAGDNLPLHRALEVARPGDVLVVDAGGAPHGAWGEVLSVAATARGVLGLVIDGGVRDTAQLEELRFPVFSRFIAIEGTLKDDEGTIEDPLTLGRARIARGDVIVADRDGIVALPSAHLDEIVAAARARAAKEQLLLGRIRAGERTMDLYGLRRTRPEPPAIAIVGAGIGGLTLALELHRAGIPCRVYEAVPAIAPLGVGINVLPHAVEVLAGLGLEDALAAVGVRTKESVFYNRFGQLIHTEPAGRAGGYAFPQFSLHRGDLQQVLLAAVRERLGDDAVVLGHRLLRADDEGDCVDLHFETAAGPAEAKARAVVGCDGIHSAVRRQFYPDEGEPVYSGVNMWRGVTTWEPFLSGASMVRAGWLSGGKMVIYPIRDQVDASGRQLVNWVAELDTPRHVARDWNRRGSLDDFIGAFEDWHFDWLDVPALIRGAEAVLEYPMVDQDPLPRWSFGRITLLGDAAHPMVPRGSNGAGQSILDAARLGRALAETDDVPTALRAYEADRLPATTAVVLTNRSAPPDILLKEVFDRTGDRPFDSIDEVFAPGEIEGFTGNYNRVVGLKKVSG